MFKIFLHKLMIIKSIYWANMCWLKGLRWGGICNSSWNWPVFSAPHTLWIRYLNDWFNWPGNRSELVFETVFIKETWLWVMCVAAGIHTLTLPQWRRWGLLLSSFNWQGILPMKERRSWQLSEGLTVYRRDYRAAKTGLCSCQYHRHHLIFIRTSTARLVLYRLQITRASEEGRRC